MVTATKMSSSAHKEATLPTHIDLAENIRMELIVLLNESLATTLDLKTQVKQAHWNVKGSAFYQLHELFDKIAHEVEEYVDWIAERAVALGGTAMGTARVAAAQSILPEYSHEIYGGREHIQALVERFGQYASLVRRNIKVCDSLGDPTTADLYTQISREIDIRLWFLEAHIQA